MTYTRKVYMSKDTLTIASGGTLVLNGTLSGTIGCAAPATLNVATGGMTVDASGNTVIGGTLTIGAGLGTITDATNVLTLTETNISLVGIVGITGATTVTGAFEVDGATTLSNGATNPSLYLVGNGNLSITESRTAVGTHVADTGTFAFCADQKSMRISIGGTVYQIPLWADA